MYTTTQVNVVILTHGLVVLIMVTIIVVDSVLIRVDQTFVHHTGLKIWFGIVIGRLLITGFL